MSSILSTLKELGHGTKGLPAVRDGVFLFFGKLRGSYGVPFGNEDGIIAKAPLPVPLTGTLMITLDK